MSGKAAKIVLTEEQQSILQQIHRSRTRHNDSFNGAVLSYWPSPD